jgi:hypothetical protein
MFIQPGYLERPRLKNHVINVTGMVFLPGHCPMDYRKVMEYAVPPLMPTNVGGRVALRYHNKDHTALLAAPGLLWTFS